MNNSFKTTPKSIVLINHLLKIRFDNCPRWTRDDFGPRRINYSPSRYARMAPGHVMSPEFVLSRDSFSDVENKLSGDLNVSVLFIRLYAS